MALGQAEPGTARDDGRAVAGPLTGVTVLELQGMGPGPFCGMVLSDFGADVIRIDRADAVGSAPPGGGLDVLSRGRRSVAVDLKDPEGAALVLDMVEQADVLIEGFRPGVAERLGVGPGECLSRNPRLIYGRVTGWGQDGPWASYAGHDIDYIGLSGVLWNIGRGGEAPVPPLAYTGDFGGGGMLLALGVCAALVERSVSGAGQVIDAAMVDGSALLNSFLYGMRPMGLWDGERGDNLLDSGAPFYDTYETADGGWIAVGAIEPHFYRNLLEGLGLDLDPADQHDRSAWPHTRTRFAEIFRTKTREEWCHLLEGAEACVAPVLSPWEAPAHPHHTARGTFTKAFDVIQPAPAPRFARTPARIAGRPARPGEHTDEVLTGLGFDDEALARLRAAGTVA